jgi:glycine/D-amino acid oxidase-like deaminating enzyme/nitrite reductase/ring-hydroxylating ferredoxin subunit
MKNISIWKDRKVSFGSRKLDSDIKCDILIIGGGLTGISTLYYLRNSNLKVVLVEQNKIGMGVTANSTGKITYLQDSMYNKIWKKYDKEIASRYLESQRDAIKLVKDIVKGEKIDCDLVKSKSYVYTNNDKEVKDVKELKEFLLNSNIDVSDDKVDLVQSKYMISVDDTYLFNPVKFIYNLVKKCNLSDKIYESTSIVKCEKDSEGYICYTSDDKQIRCKYVVISSHYPYFNLPFMFPIKGSLEKSYLCSGKKKIGNISLISYSNPFISIRNYKDNIIYLAKTHINSNDVKDKDNFEELFKDVRYLDINLDYAWSNIDIMTNDSLPYVGKIDDNMFMATGYNTWGMTNGVLGGYMVSEMIQGKDTKYNELFNPKRSGVGNIIDISKVFYYSVEGIIDGIKNKSSNIKYEKRDGHDVCIYVDDKKEHIVYRKCPHMGCKLIFNEIEKTWDCPCHGSRFDIDGKCISGPSNKDIHYKKR